MFKKIIYCALFAILLWFFYSCTEIAMNWLFINHYIALYVWLIEEHIMELALVAGWVAYTFATFSKAK